MSNQESVGSIRLPIFNGSNFVYWKIKTTTYLQSLGTDVWEILEGGYTFPSTIPTDTAGKKQHETNAKVVNTLLGSLSPLEFVKVMQLKSTKEIWDKIVLSYGGDSQVKRAKFQTLIIQYETLKMQSDESIANYFLHIDEVVNCMNHLGEDIKEVTLVEKFLRSLSAKFESKVSAKEEKQDLQTITMTQLHRILISFEMRKGGPLDMNQEKERKNTMNQDIFQKKKMRVGHYAAKCPHKDKHEKGKEYEKWNRKQVVNKISYYTHEDSDGLSNSDEDENSNDYRLLMAYEDDNFWDDLEEDDLCEEISKLKICLEENNMIIDTLTYQLAKKKHNEKLECEIVGLRKDLEKTKTLNLRLAK
eukprot:PITA_12725